MTNRILLTVCFSLVFHLSCTDAYDHPIPSYPVYLLLDLTFEDKELKAPGSYREYTVRDINPGLGERVGFGGILVVHTTMLNEYRAFDRACPHEAQSGVTVEVDGEGLNAVCPRCGTKYEVIVGLATGAPVEGVSRYGLRSYGITLSGSRLIVKN
jgi:nitrite reductase/ring-hydroxylating ferredoxin subunit